IREHAGAGLQVWNESSPTRNVLVEGNRFENNTIEVILTNVQSGTVRGNVLDHQRHPASDSPRTAGLWVEFSKGLTFERNTLRYGIINDPLPSLLIHPYASDQDYRELTWISNTWELPPGQPPISDDDVRAALAARR